MQSGTPRSEIIRSRWINQFFDKNSGRPPDEFVDEKLDDLNVVDDDDDGSRPDNEIQSSRVPTDGAN